MLLNLSNSLKRNQERHKFQKASLYKKCRFQINGRNVKHNLMFLPNLRQCQCKLLSFTLFEREENPVSNTLGIIKTTILLKN